VGGGGGGRGGGGGGGGGKEGEGGGVVGVGWMAWGGPGWLCSLVRVRKGGKVGRAGLASDRRGKFGGFCDGPGEIGGRGVGVAARRADRDACRWEWGLGGSVGWVGWPGGGGVGVVGIDRRRGGDWRGVFPGIFKRKTNPKTDFAFLL